MEALEELAPGHGYELRFGIVLEAPGDLARRITPVGWYSQRPWRRPMAEPDAS